MDQKLKDWIIKQHELQYEQLGPDAKRDFLRLLKAEPAEVEQVFYDELYKWNAAGGYHLDMSFKVQDRRQEAQELLKAFQEHFAREMAAITQ